MRNNNLTIGYNFFRVGFKDLHDNLFKRKPKWAFKGTIHRTSINRHIVTDRWNCFNIFFAELICSWVDDNGNIDGSVHKGSKTIYFWFWLFYTTRQISTNPIRWRQPFWLVSSFLHNTLWTKELKLRRPKCLVHKRTTKFCEHKGSCNTQTSTFTIGKS